MILLSCSAIEKGAFRRCLTKLKQRLGRLRAGPKVGRARSPRRKSEELPACRLRSPHSCVWFAGARVLHVSAGKASKFAGGRPSDRQAHNRWLAGRHPQARGCPFRNGLVLPAAALSSRVRIPSASRTKRGHFPLQVGIKLHQIALATEKKEKKPLKKLKRNAEKEKKEQMKKEKRKKNSKRRL